MSFNLGDFVTRKSYSNDIVFKILKIEGDTVYLKGVDLRLCADAPITDIVKLDNFDGEDTFNIPNTSYLDERSDEYFYLPGKILHLDGDSEYLNRCLKFYKEHKVFAVGKKIKEDNMKDQIPQLVNEYRPDVIVITGHDSYNKKHKNHNDLSNYKNSSNFIKAVKAARNIEKSQDKLVIIAGACQSNYEELIKAGANFASSPKRINIHALDPAIIAFSIATLEKNKNINLKEVLSKTKYGPDGIGGIKSTGLMYVGFPR